MHSGMPSDDLMQSRATAGTRTSAYVVKVTRVPPRIRTRVQYSHSVFNCVFFDEGWGTSTGGIVFLVRPEARWYF